MIIGRYRIVLPSADSTNKEAFRLLEKRDLPEGTIVITSNQTAGRGQADASWESEPNKNLTFSIILKPVFLQISLQFMLTKVLALAVHSVVEQLVESKPVFIKWPNDIYIGNGKVAGMLIENRIMGKEFQVSVAGIGLNINQRFFLSQAPNPVSVSQFTQKLHDVDHVLNLLCHAVDHRYQQLLNQKLPEIDKEYLQKLLGYNQKRQFIASGKQFEATITAVNEFGHLVLEQESGLKKEYDLKEVKFLF
jgi:BirA family transcriptional regulator, biotin operon repressor / biotin---[acetyl-CoA-carboxylase] ligase